MFFSIPGKTFILGEYAILGGLPAIVAAVSPRFSLQPGPGVPAPFHPESPAGKLLSGTRSSHDFPFVFHDPLGGAGGFGASTAQFALSYYAVAHAEGWSLAWQDVWKKYRELATGSGADLMTQWLGGIVRCQVSPLGVPSVEALPEFAPRFGQSKGFHWSDLMVFSASHQTGRKTATHHHLDGLKGDQFTRVLEKLRAPLDAGFAAIQNGDGVQLGQALGDYADVLKEAGLEIEPTFRDRQALSKIPGVLGVKGTGANQSDAIIVLADSNPRYKEQITEAALSRGLKLVSSGLTMENGIQSL
jgi:mevalonate kinase